MNRTRIIRGRSYNFLQKKQEPEKIKLASEYSSLELEGIAKELFYSHGHCLWAWHTFKNWEIFEKYITEEHFNFIRQDVKDHLYSESDNFITYQFNDKLYQILTESQIKLLEVDNKEWSSGYICRMG